MNNFSNIKRMGVKSIHYNKKDIIIEDSFSKQQAILFDVLYDNIRKLNKAENIQKFDRSSNSVDFYDIKNKKGFSLSKRVNNTDIVSKIKRVKKSSYIQSLLGITDENNIEIQIYHNYEDIRKIIGNYCNKVMYSLNSISKINLPEGKDFDNIGAIPAHIFLGEYRDKENAKVKLIKDVIPAMRKVLEQYQISKEKKGLVEWFNVVKVYQFFDANIAGGLKKLAINNLGLNLKTQSLLMKFYQDNTQEVKGFVSRYQREFIDYEKQKRYNANLKNANQRFSGVLNKDAFVDKLKKYIIKAKEKEVTEEDVVTYEYLRLLSTIRNYATHGRIDLKSFEFNRLLSLAKQDIDTFVKDFVKNNTKYWFILSNAYNDESVLQEFFDFSVFGEIKNVLVSIDKLRKIITEKLNISAENVKEKKNAGEYLNKLKKLIAFDIFKTLKDGDSIQQIVIELKESASQEEKESVYNKVAENYIKERKGFIEKLMGLVEKYSGEFKDNFNKAKTDKIGLDSGNICRNEFINLLYVFATFLTKKEANSFFADIINKVESIAELYSLAQIVGIDVDTTKFCGIVEIIPLDSNFEQVRKQLSLLRNLKNTKAARFIKDKSSTMEEDEIKKLYYAFKKSTYSLEDFVKDLKKDEQGNVVAKPKSRALKPLKNFLRNNVYSSKYYEYLTSYSDTKICPLIMKNKDVVKFVLFNMLGQGVDVDELCITKQDDAMYKFLSKVYHDFMMDDIKSVDPAYNINKAHVLELVNVLSEFCLEDLVRTIFNKNDKNYQVIIRLYLLVCYLVVKNIMDQNTSYFIAFQDYEKHYKAIKKADVVFDMTVVCDFVKRERNKKSRSYNQLKVLLEKPYIKGFVDGEEYKRLVKDYRNVIAHSSILNRLGLWDKEIVKVTSYFALFQILIQRQFEKQASEVWGDKFEKYFVSKNKGFSTKLCVALNMTLAYNISRFNNITIEKYSTKSRG